MDSHNATYSSQSNSTSGPAGLQSEADQRSEPKRPDKSAGSSTLPIAIHPLSLIKAVWNHKVLCLAVFLLLSLATMLVVRRLPSVYRAEAAILVESQRIPEKFVSATVNPDLQDRLNILSEQILSYTRLMELIQRYDLYHQERAHLVREEIVEKMRADITIKPERSGTGTGRPGAFRISYQGSNPNVVAQVTNQVANFFIEENLRQREIEAVGTSQFLESQLAEAKKRLEEQETMLSRYKLQFNGELPQQENALIASTGQAKVQLMGVQDAINRAEQNKAMLEASLSSAQAAEAALTQMLRGPSGADSEARRTVAGLPAAQLVVPLPPKESDLLETQLAQLKLRYSEDHPDVRRAKDALERARAAEKKSAISVPKPSPPALSGEPRVPAPVPASGPANLAPQAGQVLVGSRERVDSLKLQISAADHEIESLNKERQTIMRELNSMQTRIEKLPVREQQLAAVTRDYETTKAAYQSLLDKKLSADVAADMEKRQKAERFVMLESARVPELPVKPKRLVLDAGGCIFALAIGIALAIALEFRKGVLMGEWELPSNVEILGRVPKITMATVDSAPVSPGRSAPQRWTWVRAMGILVLIMAGVWASLHFGLVRY